MIVDIHVHVPKLFFDPTKTDELFAGMEKMLQFGHSAGIDRQVILALGYGPVSNQVLKQLVDRFPDELVPFFRGSCIDPDCPAMMERCAKEYGFKGVKLHEEMPEFPLVGLLAGHALFRKAGELGLPVLIHSWHTEEGVAEVAPELLQTGYFPVSLMEELGKRHPETTFIFAHAGGMWVKAFQAAQPYPNLCFDVSGFDPERGVVEKAVELLGAKRVFFGSDVPGRSYVAQLAKVQYADISASDKALILGENAASLFHLR